MEADCDEGFVGWFVVVLHESVKKVVDGSDDSVVRYAGEETNDVLVC